MSGILNVTMSGDLLILDFPSRPPVRSHAPETLVAAIGKLPLEVWEGRDYMFVYETEEDVINIKPDFEKLARIAPHGVIVTAPGNKTNFVSRFFAPALGIPEDPVTGSAHTMLIPYWSNRLGWKEMSALQLSERGGEIFCEESGERVLIKGRAITYMKGEIYL